MGMHHGIVAASASQAELLTELERHTGEFLVGAPVASPFDAEPAATDEGWRMAIGDPLPTEAEQPIEDLDGEGLLAAMATLGLDARPWLHAGPAVVVDYDGERFPNDGPIEQVRSTHDERYKRPRDEWLSEIVAVERPPREQQPPP